MVGVTFFGNFRPGEPVHLTSFWLFFRRTLILLPADRNMREGIPLVDEDGNESATRALLSRFRRTSLHPSPCRGRTVRQARTRPQHVSALSSTTTGRWAATVPLSCAHRRPDGRLRTAPAFLPARARERAGNSTPHFGHAKNPCRNRRPDSLLSSTACAATQRGLPRLSRADQVVAHVSDMWIRTTASNS